MKSRLRTKGNRTLLSISVLVILILACFVVQKLSVLHPEALVEDEDHHQVVGAEDKTPESQRAVRDSLISLLDPQDSNSIFSVIDKIQADPSISKNCHEIAHDVGHKAYVLYGFSDAMTFNNPNHVKHALPQYICAGGYMHGILEELSLHEPGFLERPEIICDTVSAADRESCFHGVGHVFMMHNSRDVAASILDCRVIKMSANMYRCFEGVRMEQFWGNADNTNATVLGWDPLKPFDTCKVALDDEKPTCFLYSPFGYLKVHPKDYSGAANQCATADLKQSDAFFCLKGLGMTMMSKFKGQNLEGSEVFVEGLSVEQKHAFYQGVIGYSSLSGVSPSELKTACSLLKHDSLICEDALSLSGVGE